MKHYTRRQIKKQWDRSARQAARRYAAWVAELGREPTFDEVLKRAYAEFPRCFSATTPLLVDFRTGPRSPARATRRMHLQPEGWPERLEARRQARQAAWQQRAERWTGEVLYFEVPA